MDAKELARLEAVSLANLEKQLRELPYGEGVVVASGGIEALLETGEWVHVLVTEKGGFLMHDPDAPGTVAIEGHFAYNHETGQLVHMEGDVPE